MYGTALQAAARWGSKGIVQLLVANGADVNIQGGIVELLRAAALWSNESIVQLLLDEGADVNAQVGNVGNALEAAACFRNRVRSYSSCSTRVLM